MFYFKTIRDNRHPIMEDYPFHEMADIKFMYGQANGNGRMAARLYLQVFKEKAA